MDSQRCETCRHFVAWTRSFPFQPEGVCTVIRAEHAPKMDREVRKWGGQKCQMWEEDE